MKRHELVIDECCSTDDPLVDDPCDCVEEDDTDLVDMEEFFDAAALLNESQKMLALLMKTSFINPAIVANIERLRDDINQFIDGFTFESGEE